MVRASIFVIGAWALMACTTDRVELLVDLRTDLVPGTDFVEAESLLLAVGKESGEEQSKAVAEGASTLDGIRIAEFANLTPGRYRLVVTLREPGATLVVERPIELDLKRSFAVTALITRDCRGVECPPDGSSAEEACLAGTCVDPRCTPETPSYCPAEGCISDTECGSETAPSDCATGTCAGTVEAPGTCIYSAAPAECTPENPSCDVDFGCYTAGDPILTGNFDLEEPAPFVRIAADATGDVLVTGLLTQPATFGEAGRLSPGSIKNAFVTRVSPQGELRWATVLGGGAQASPTDIAATADGGALVVGGFTGAGDFGGLPLSAGAAVSGFIAQLDLAGRVTWARGQKGDGTVHINGVATAPTGDLYLVGTTTGSLEGAGCEVGSPPTEDAFVMRLSGDGASVRWCRRFGGTGTEQGLAVASAPAGVFVAGTFTETTSFGGEAFSAGLPDGFVLALSSDTGEHLWSVPLQSAATVTVGGLALSSKGEAIVTGGAGGGRTTDLRILDWTRPSGGVAGISFAAALNATDGGFMWADAQGDSALITIGRAVVADADGVAHWLAVDAGSALRSTDDGSRSSSMRLDFDAHDLAMDASDRLVVGATADFFEIGRTNVSGMGLRDDVGLIRYLN